MMKQSFVVSLEMPERANVKQMASYIRIAVMTDCGRLNPNDPLFNLDQKSVIVVSVPAKANKE